MKKYNLLIAGSIIFYLFLVLYSCYAINQTRTDKEKLYKIEINRISYSLFKEKVLDKDTLESYDWDSYEYVKNVSYIPMSEIMTEENNMVFFEENNNMGVKIRPVFMEGKLNGLLRFDYLEPVFHIKTVFVTIQACLFAMEIFLLLILIYLKKQLVSPFLHLSSLSYEMANGHFEKIVKEEKSRYFKDFLRGIGQLKDSLSTAKKRQMELEKEKKKMLLSLSHDIRTPLNMIKLYGNALEEDLYTDEVKKTCTVRKIVEKAAEIECYVEEIIKNSREDILDIRVKKEEFYQADLIKKVLDTYEEKCRINLLTLEIGTFENVLLKGDIERTLEVFENIFENAFKYGDGRIINISFYEEDYCHLIRIFNTGIPVTDNEFNHIFESFFRASNSGGQQGSGLGLYICREIMKKMGGEIFAQKEEDGMAFVLVFR